MKEWWTKAADAYKAGLSVPKIGALVFRSTYSIKYVLRKMDVPLRTEDESNAVLRAAKNAGTDWWPTARDMYLKGASVTQIIEAVKRSPLAVRRALVRMGCYSIPGGAPAWWDDAITLYGHGYPLNEIAELERHTKQEVTRALLDSGVYRKRASIYSSDDPQQRLREGPEWHEKAIFWYRQGKTLEEVGTMFGVTRERVRQVLVKYGVGTRSIRETWAKRSAITQALNRRPCSTCRKLFFSRNPKTVHCSHRCAHLQYKPWIVHAASLALKGMSLGKAVRKVGHDMGSRAAAVTRLHQFLRRNGLLNVIGKITRRCKAPSCGTTFEIERKLGIAARIYCDEHRFRKNTGRNRPIACHLDGDGSPKCGMYSKRPMRLTDDLAEVTCTRCKLGVGVSRAPSIGVGIT